MLKPQRMRSRLARLPRRAVTRLIRVLGFGVLGFWGGGGGLKYGTLSK